jgi:hypothetical protein
MLSGRTSTFVRPVSIVSTTLADLGETSLARLSADGFNPCPVVETRGPATFQALAQTSRERFRSSSEPSPLRYWPSGTTLTTAQRTGGDLADFRASRTANQNTESRMASSLSGACTATVDNSTQWRRPSSKRSQRVARLASRNTRRGVSKVLFLLEGSGVIELIS